MAKGIYLKEEIGFKTVDLKKDTTKKITKKTTKK